jgi:hypothetical protein
LRFTRDLSPSQGISRCLDSTHLNSQDLSIQLPSLIGSNTSSNNRSADTTSPTQSSLGRKEDIRDVLVFTEEGEVEYDLDGFDVGGEDDEFTNTSVEGFGGFVGSVC